MLLSKIASSRRGAALAITLLALLLMVVFTVLAFTSGGMTYNVTARYRNSIVAQEAARAGLAQALLQLQQTPGWNAGFSNVALTNSGAAFSMTFASGTGPYSTNNQLGASPTTGYNGRVVPAGCAYLYSTGTYHGITSTSKMMVSRQVLQPFNNGLAANSTINLNGVTADSFNSATGSYAATHVNSGFNLLTNGTAPSSISVRSKSKVYGSAIVGPLATSSTVYVGSLSLLTGGVHTDSAVASFPDLAAPTGSSAVNQSFTSGTASLSPGTYGDLTLSGATLNLTSGTYVFNSISTLYGTINAANVSGPVYIYVTHSVGLMGTAIVNHSNVPGNLWLIESGSPGQSLGLAPLGPAYMVVYAPDDQVTLAAPGEFFGAVVASTINVTSAILHYDSNLAKVTGPAVGMAVAARWGD